MEIKQKEDLKKQCSDAITEISRIIQSFHRQEYYLATLTSKKFLTELSSLLQSILSEMDFFNQTTQWLSADMVVSNLKSMLSAQENQDYILLADLYEIQLEPFIEQVIHCLIQEHDTLDSITQNGVTYRVEMTSCGLPTLCIQDDVRSFYLHTNRYVMQEADSLVHEWYQEEVDKYNVYGLGLGYFIQALASLSEYIQITVFESDSTIIELCKKYGVYQTLIQNPQIRIVEDKQCDGFLKELKNPQENSCFCIHAPSVRLIQQESVRTELEDYFIQQSSIQIQKKSLDGNFKRNTVWMNHAVDELKTVFHQKTVYLIGAGPSLDKNYLELKKVSNNSIIIATGTVYKKLMKENIRVDYVIVTDANAHTYTQIEGMENRKISFILLSTVYYRIPLSIASDKYYICQSGYFKAEEYAKIKGVQCYETGGSVITTALDIAIRLNSLRIVLVGVDLAFTDGKDHAEDTAFMINVSKKEERMVESVDKKMVPTAKNLDIYRKWIERRIKKSPKTEVIDATEGGALIHGTKLATLQSVVNEDRG